jgi:hypothetical protein
MRFLNREEILQRIRKEPKLADTLLFLGSHGVGSGLQDIAYVSPEYLERSAAGKELASRVLKFVAEKPKGREKILFDLLKKDASTFQIHRGVSRFIRMGGTLDEARRFMSDAYSFHKDIEEAVQARALDLNPKISVYHDVITNIHCLRGRIERFDVAISFHETGRSVVEKPKGAEDLLRYKLRVWNARRKLRRRLRLLA